MKLKIFLLGLFFSVQSFSSENIIFNLFNNTDDDIISYAYLSQAKNKAYCISTLNNATSINFSENFYTGYCSEKAKKNGKNVTDSDGNQLYYATCELFVYSFKNCSGNKIGSITLDRGSRTNKYVNESTMKNISKLIVRARNDDENGINNNEAIKGYILLQSREGEKVDIGLQNTIYYMINNKSKSFMTIGVNSPCEIDKKIGTAGGSIPTLPPGNSIWSIPNWWLHDECKTSSTCTIYLYEVISPKTCGNTIGAIEVDLSRKNEELITLYDYNYQLSMRPYLKTSFKVRRAITITDHLNQ